MSQLGRIGGQVLTDNLLRSGIDLAFDTDLLYLKVSPVQTFGAGGAINEDGDPNYGKAFSTSSPSSGIGINTDVPIYDFDIASNIRTGMLTVDTQLAIANLRINTPNTITTSVGGIGVFIAGSEIFHDRLVTRTSATDYLSLDGNRISSFNNSNIVFDPNGAGQVMIGADTNLTGNLSISGNTVISGDLSSASTIIVGDQTIDTVTINTDFTQSIVPGDNLTYAMGADAADSSARRWSQAYSPDWTNITTGAWPGSGLRPTNAIVSEQMRLGGDINKIAAIQSNDDILLNPNTGIVFIESTKWQDDDITNLQNTAITFGSTGIGYTRIMGDSAVLFPAGTTAEQRVSPEIGESRWNTDLQYLECFDGTVWQVSIGAGPTVTANDMETLSNVFILVLG